MCLSELKVFEPADYGYQVKRKDPINGTYEGIYFKNVRRMEKGVCYKAIRSKVEFLTKGYYHTGFHVFHDLENAREYQNSINCEWLSTFIVRVKTGGIRVTGIQRFTTALREEDPYDYDPFRRVYDVHAKVTVCSEMTILEEVE